MPAPANRRKRRLIRSDGPPDDLMMVIRATPNSRTEAAADIADSASLSAHVYIIELAEGVRHLLFGVSVFAHPDDQDVSTVLDRFAAAPMFVEASVGVLRRAGFEVLPTGENTSHYDIQLLGGVTEDQQMPSDEVIRAAAACLLDAAGQLRPNPSYAGRGNNEPEEE